MSKRKNYLITSAQACAKLHTRFWEGLLAYAKAHDSEIIVLPLIGNSAAEDWSGIHPMFQEYLELGERHLNSNIAVRQLRVKPQQIDPSTGQTRFAQRGTTIVFASPKQRLRAVSHSNQKYPKFLITTGCCTRPNYMVSGNADRERLGVIAERDHIIGALVVEVQDNRKFHFRHIRANSEGVFVDLGVVYGGDKAEAKCEAMVLGDFHCGQSEPQVVQATYEMLRTYKPRKIFLHDFFDGHSVSHWLEKKPVRELLLQVYDKGMFSLEGELKEAGRELLKLSKLAEEVIVVFSNHHAFLHRYLEEGRFLKQNQIQNYRVSLELLKWMAAKDYNDPVEAGIKMFTNLPANVKFLREDADYKVHGFQLGAHGDKSDSGGKFGGGYGGIQKKEIAWGKSVSGHVHSAEILRDTYTVGTMLPLHMYYMRGYPTSWTHTHALLWATGQVQLVSIIDGKWRS